MRKNLLSVGLLAIALSANAQMMTHIGDTGTFYVGEGALVYNGGGLQTRGSGIMDVHGNVMVVGASTDELNTLDNNGAARTAAAGNIVLRLNTPSAIDGSTYGQLYIHGLTNVSAFVNKEFRTRAHGNGSYFQQVALPFKDKAISSLSGELNKTFGTTRWTQNEVLKWNNNKVVSEHFQNLSQVTADPTGYYMLGSSANNLNTATPPSGWATIAPTAPGSVYTISGKPYPNGITRQLKDAGVGANWVNFGPNGTYTNQYGELYNSYIQDQFQMTIDAVPFNGMNSNYGKNIFQFGNPYFTNLDLYYIGINEGANGDGNALGDNVWGVRYDPGTVTTLPNGSTYSTGALTQTYGVGGAPSGDIGLTIKPMQAFVIKMRNNNGGTLNFDTLRRFGATKRTVNDYSVTAARTMAKSKTVKQLGVIAYDEDDNEVGRTYYVVSSISKTGHQTTAETSRQAANGGGNMIGTFEEDPINGMYDNNYVSNYWLYINEANEVDFQGKPVPMVIYDPAIKKLKFEVRENAELINTGVHALSSGIGFFYKASNGTIKQIKQGDKIPVTATEYGLFYGGKPAKSQPSTQSAANIRTAGTAAEQGVPSRTMIVYNPAIDDYVVRFDGTWMSASVKVYDMGGKLILSADNVPTTSDYVISLDKKVKSTYLVNATSEKGKVASAKIIR